MHDLDSNFPPRVPVGGGMDLGERSNSNRGRIKRRE
jgi:hypothetical protein